MISYLLIDILTICDIGLQISIEEEEAFFLTKLYISIAVVALVVTISLCWWWWSDKPRRVLAPTLGPISGGANQVKIPSCRATPALLSSCLLRSRSPWAALISKSRHRLGNWLRSRKQMDTGPSPASN